MINASSFILIRTLLFVFSHMTAFSDTHLNTRTHTHTHNQPMRVTMVEINCPLQYLHVIENSQHEPLPKWFLSESFYPYLPAFQTLSLHVITLHLPLSSPLHLSTFISSLFTLLPLLTFPWLSVLARCISSPPSNFPTLPPLPPLRLQPSPASCPHSPSRTARQPC